MNEDNLQTILKSIASKDDSFTVRSYSGRGMYGESCLAISFNGSITRLFGAVLRAAEGVEFRPGGLEDIAQAFEDARQDNMGRGTVVYFTNEKYVQDSDDEECESDTDLSKPDVT